MEIRLPPNEDLSLSMRSIRSAITSLQADRKTELNIALANLLKASAIEINYLIDKGCDLSIASMSTRNIFEIYLILLTITSKKEALSNWFGQAHRDSKDIRDGFIKVALNKGLDVSELQQIQRFEDDALDQSPYESNRGFNIKDLATQHGYLDDYMFVYKLSSKLVHPTSMKVNSYNALVQDSNYLSVVQQLGVYFAQKIEQFSLRACEKRV